MRVQDANGEVGYHHGGLDISPINRPLAKGDIRLAQLILAVMLLGSAYTLGLGVRAVYHSIIGVTDCQPPVEANDE